MNVRCIYRAVILSACLTLPTHFAAADPPGPGANFRDPSLVTYELSDDLAGELPNQSLPPDCTVLPFTGADVCSNTTVTEVAVGPPGFFISTTVSGDSSASTLDSDCIEFGQVWWEAFRIDVTADVIIEFCCTDPAIQAFLPTISPGCPAGGSCPFVLSSNFGNGGPFCGDGNSWMTFVNLPAGTYFVPIVTDTGSGAVPGPYQMHIKAASVLGTCCDGDTGQCSEDVDLAFCSGANDTFTLGGDCCSVECSGPGEFSSLNVTLLSHLPFGDFPGNPHTAADVWGYTSPSGREYALIGFTNGTGFVDITDPVNPVVLGTISGQGVNSIWRDMAVYDEYAYIVTDGSGVGVQIVDLRNIDAGQISLINSTDLGVGFVNAHNVFINEQSGYMYLAIPNLNGGRGLMAVDLKPNPTNPTGAKFWTDPSPGVRCHDVQVVTYQTGPFAGREIAFCFAENDGLHIADVTDKSSNTSMFTMSQLSYPNTTYTHQGWLSFDRQYLFIGDEGDESGDPDVVQTVTYVADVSDLFNPFLASTFGNGLCAIDHNLMTRGNCVYEANYSTGLRVFEVSDINNITEIAFFDTHPENNSINFDGAWGVFTDFASGVVVVSDRDRGLFVFNHQCAPVTGPVAQLTYTPDPAACHEQITLDGSTSLHLDAGRSIVLWEWDFDYDGLSFDVEASGVTAQHTYDALGSFTAALRVTGDGIPPLKHVQTGQIEVTAGNALPTAVPGGPYETLERTDFVLDASQSSDPDGGCGDSVQKYSWDLDNDGVGFEVTSSQPIVEVAWSVIQALNLGLPDVPRTIRLRVEDSIGGTHDSTTTLTVLGDCNFNGLHDAVEIANQQAVDANGNGAPDECDAVAPVTAPFPHDVRKNRFISFDPGNPAAPVAFRVALLDRACSATSKKCSTDQDCKICSDGAEVGVPCASDSQCPGGTCVLSGESCETQNVPVLLGWVSEPVQAGGDAPAGTSTATVVGVQPAFRVWAEATVHIGDCEIAPVQTYGLTAVSAVMESETLVLSTIEKPEGKSWGDIVGSFNGILWTPPNGLVNVDDVSAILKFITEKPAPHITVTDLAGAGPSFVNFIVNSTDLFLIIQAFKAKTYPPQPFLLEGYPANGDLTLCP